MLYKANAKRQKYYLFYSFFNCFPMATQHPDIRQDIDTAKTAPSLANNADYGRIGGLRERFGKAAANLSMVAVFGSPFAAMADTVPSDALATPTTAAASAVVPNARATLAELSPDAKAIAKQILLHGAFTSTNIVDKNGHDTGANFQIATDADETLAVLRTTVGGDAAKQGGIVAVVAVTPHGLFQLDAQDKFTPFDGNSLAYPIRLTNGVVPIALKSLKGQSLGHVQFYVGAGDTMQDIMDGQKYAPVLELFANKTVVESKENIMPGESAIFVVDAAKLAAKLPANITSCIGGTCTIVKDGIERPGTGLIYAGETLKISLPAGTKSLESRFVTVGVGDDNKEFVANTLEYSTVKAETLSDDKNNATPSFTAVSLILPEGAKNAVLTQIKDEGFISTEYKTGMVVQVDKNKPNLGIRCKISYEVDGVQQIKYFTVFPKKKS